GLLPLDHLERDSGEIEQRGLLPGEERLEGALPCGAVLARTRNLADPAVQLTLQLVGRPSVLPPEEVALHVLHARLDLAFLARVVDGGGVDLEAVVARQLAVAAVERGPLA